GGARRTAADRRPRPRAALHRAGAGGDRFGPVGLGHPGVAERGAGGALGSRARGGGFATADTVAGAVTRTALDRRLRRGSGPTLFGPDPRSERTGPPVGLRRCADLSWSFGAFTAEVAFASDRAVVPKPDLVGPLPIAAVPHSSTPESPSGSHLPQGRRTRVRRER